MSLMTPDQVKVALESYGLSHHKMAKVLGCSREAVRSVRIGKSFRDVHPDLPRWHTVRAPTAEYSCALCQHWRSDECDLGFPDPKEDGHGFAHECINYSPDRSQSISAA
jgi:hypothetical protein